MAELFRDLAVARADGSFGQYLLKLARIDVLVLDDFAMAPLKGQERRDFLEICDDRYQRRSTILTSQVPVAHWHEQIGDPSIADSIMDRLVHNAYRIELDGESIRKLRGRKPPQEAARYGFAATLLSDSAFKLFVWTCLHAERNSGRLRLVIPDLARSLQKTEREIGRCVHELVSARVCRFYASDSIEMPERF
jgi:hypothetical protein